MIKSLSSLRFIFAIIIMLHHSRINGVRISEPAGPIGVTFFLILSGFSMSLGYYKSSQRKDFSYLKYVWNRIIRIYPLHLFCIGLFIVTTDFGLSLDSLGNVIPNILLLQSWSPDTVFSCNPVSWCLSDLLFFYLLFPFIVRIVKRISLEKLSILLFTILFLYTCCISVINEDSVHYYVYIFPVSRFLDFFIGIYLYKIYIYTISNKQPRIMLKYNVNTLELLLLILFVLAFYVYSSIPLRYSLVLLSIIPSSLTILYFSIAQQINMGGGISKILNKKKLINCGKYSFTFYMLHVLIIWYERKIVDNFSIQLNSYALWFLTFATILIMSKMTYNYIENPITKYLRK